MSSNERSYPTAKISIIMGKFERISDGGCTHTKEIILTDNANGAVSVDCDDSNIIVVHEKAYLEFSVKAEDLHGHAYTPVGIGFTETAVSGTHQTSVGCEERSHYDDPLGHAAFPTRAISFEQGTTLLTVFDAWPRKAEFEYNVFIQRSDGASGVVDPKIRNWPK